MIPKQLSKISVFDNKTSLYDLILETELSICAKGNCQDMQVFEKA